MRLKSSCCKQKKAGQGPGNKVSLALLSLNIPHIYHASLLLTLVSQPHPLPGGEVPHCGDCWGDRQRQDHPGQRRRRQSLALCCESPFTQPSTPISYLHNGVTRSFHLLIQETNEKCFWVKCWKFSFPVVMREKCYCCILTWHRRKDSCKVISRALSLHLLHYSCTLVRKRWTDGASFIYLHSYVIPTFLFAYFLVCHPYIFLCLY